MANSRRVCPDRNNRVTLCPMPESEHPAAKAGRFVRAAGQALGAAAKELEKERREREAAAPAEVTAPRPQPVPIAPPPPQRTGGPVGNLVFYGFTVSLVAFVLAALNVDQLIAAGNTRLGFRIVLTVILIGEAFMLTSNWQQANQRLVQRLLTRIWGPRAAMNRRERTFARAARDLLTLLGILMLALGVFEILRATVGY
jgi:hypothetical protein